MLGAREGTLSGFRKLVAAAMARDLRVFVLPGPEIARAHGLDLSAAGLQMVASPRHASVLLMVGEMPLTLLSAATVAYAQMMRPRALFVLGEGEIWPFPSTDVRAPLSPEGLTAGIMQLQDAFAKGAFRTATSDFDAPALKVRVEYVCPMHPEVVRDESGECPKCGMTLMPREASSRQHDSGHGDHVGHEGHGAHSGQGAQRAGDDHDGHGTRKEHGSHHGHDDDGGAATHGDAAADYTCSMHPEISQSEPGKCPKCGMTLMTRSELAHSGEHGGHGHHGDHATHDDGAQGHGAAHGGDDSGTDHGSMDHAGMGFMSMVEVTKGLPRSGDGLPMEWIDAPFGPFFPGLPGGLSLNLTLDGDTIARAEVAALPDPADLLPSGSMTPDAFAARLSGLIPFAPVSYALLACRAIEAAASIEVPDGTARGRVVALERERIASHLNWLALFGHQNGLEDLAMRAASLQLAIARADVATIKERGPTLRALCDRVRRMPLLRTRLSGVGRLADADDLRGPVLRASGRLADGRSDDPASVALGFAPVSATGGDALGRLRQRLDEIEQSLALIAEAGSVAAPVLAETGAVSGQGAATIETPRGAGTLKVTLEVGRVTAAEIGSPSVRHLTLIPALCDQQELGDALVAIGSLDLCPWEARL